MTGSIEVEPLSRAVSLLKPFILLVIGLQSGTFALLTAATENPPPLFLHLFRENFIHALVAFMRQRSVQILELSTIVFELVGRTIESEFRETDSVRFNLLVSAS